MLYSIEYQIKLIKGFFKCFKLNKLVNVLLVSEFN